MSKGSAKVWWIIIILIIIIGGVWWWNSSQSATVVAPESNPSVTATQTNSAPAAAVSGLQTSPTDTSNTALNQDLNSVDSQMSGLSSDNAAVDQSLSSSSAPLSQ